METHKDTQREHDINQQRAYGENESSQQERVADQDAVTAAGVKKGEQTEDLDHGYLRDETGVAPVVSPKDELHPNAPETLGADTGAVKADVSEVTQDVRDGAQTLEDAYSKNADGVETKE